MPLDPLERKLKSHRLARPPAALDRRIQESLGMIETSEAADVRMGWRWAISGLTAAVVAAGVIIALTINLKPVEARGPAIDFEETLLDFGDLPLDKPSHRAIVVFNRGDKALKIREVTTTCGCAIATFDACTVRPGYKTVMIVTIDPNHNEHPYGTNTLVITSNDPKNPQITCLDAGIAID